VATPKRQGKGTPPRDLRRAITGTALLLILAAPTPAQILWGELQRLHLPAALPSGAELVDLDGDGDLDYVGGGSSVQLCLNDGTGRFQAIPPTWSGAQANQPLVGDLDGDGGRDIVVNRRWHAAAPLLAQTGRDYAVEFGGTECASGLAVPAVAALAGQQFGVQAVLLDGLRYHLTPIVYDTVQ
jgi:hypothetical protein